MFFNAIDDKEIVVDFVVDTAAYASGDAMTAEAVEIPNAVPTYGGQSRLRKVVVTDGAKQAPAMTLLFFNKKPTGVTINTALAISDAENEDSFVGAVSLVTGDWKTTGNNSQATKLVDDLPFRAKNGKSLWVWLLSEGTPTFTNASDLRARFTFGQNY